MTRIHGLPEKETGLLGRFAYRFSRRRFGEVPEPVRAMAHHRNLLLGTGAMELALDRSDLVDDRLKKLAETKVALVVGCEFCIDIGSMLEGTGDHGRPAPGAPPLPRERRLLPLEKLILEYAAGMSGTPAAAPDDLFGALREHFDEAQMVELTAATAWENHRARSNHALGMGHQGFSEGSLCLLPEVPEEGISA